MMLETVQGLRDLLASQIRSWQQESAATYAAAEVERDKGNTQNAIWLQDIAARRYSAVEGGLDWLLDEPFLVDWCAKINHGREEDERKRRAAHEAALAEMQRVDAMSPTERAEYERKRLELRIMLDGLIVRDVQ